MTDRVVYAGADLSAADAAIIMIHGRNAAPENILDLLPVLDRPRFAALAPAAPGGAWYPHSFMAPRESNEPGISNGLAQIGKLVEDLTTRGFPIHKIMLLGFSQGAHHFQTIEPRHINVHHRNPRPQFLNHFHRRFAVRSFANHAKNSVLRAQSIRFNTSSIH